MSIGTTGSAAVLEVTDVQASAAYYRDKLGFSYDRFWGDPPSFCIVCRGKVTIFLDQSNGDWLVVRRPESSS